jgi:hypothetical protein
MRTGLRALTMIALGVLLAAGPGVALAADGASLPPGGTFLDDDGLPEEGYIEAAVAAGITTGCNPPSNDRFCPDRTLTRAEMATMLVRALDLPASSLDAFTDDGNSVHEASINALAAAGITRGCDPPHNTMFCPDDPVDRGQVAAFLVRALGLTEGGDIDHFTDDDESVFEHDINLIAGAGVTSGCGTAAYCPRDPLPRRQMAVFLARALGLTPMVPPERPPPPFPDVGDGKRIIYSNARQRVWLVDEHEQLVDTYLVSGRRGVPAPGTYHIYSKSLKAWAGHNGITMEHMARFAHGTRLSYGFHSIPRYANGTPMQTEAELGEYRSGGCVRQADDKAEALYAWAPIGTTVIVLP